MAGVQSKKEREGASETIPMDMSGRSVIVTSIPASLEDNAAFISSASLVGMLAAASNRSVAALQLSAYDASSDRGSGEWVSA